MTPTPCCRRDATARALRALLVGALFPVTAGRSGEVAHFAFDGALTGQHGGPQESARTLPPTRPTKVAGKPVFGAGRHGRALLITNDDVAVTYATGTLLSPARGTISVWFNPVNWTGKEQVIHSFVACYGAQGALDVYILSGKGVAVVSKGAAPPVSVAVAPHEPSFMPGEWHHLAATWSQRALCVYLDGALAASVPRPLLPETMPPEMRVGDMPHSTAAQVAPGQQTLLDDLRLFDVDLPAEQILRLTRDDPVSAEFPPTIAVSPFPSQKTWRVTVDPRRSGTLTCRLTVTRDGGDETVAETRAFVADGAGNLSTDMSTDLLTPGGYTLAAVLRDQGGEEFVAASARQEHKPWPPPWLGTEVGLDDGTPITPYPPIERRNVHTAVVWNRALRLDGVLPSSILIGGRELFADPPRFLVTLADGEPQTVPSGRAVIN